MRILRRCWPSPCGWTCRSLQRKLLAGGRGGWCFEHNLLLQSVLEALGYSVTGLAARVLSGQSPQSTPPRSHMLLRVDMAGEAYIADVGFGGSTLTAPLRLVADLAQQTPHGRFVLRPGARGWSLWALLPQGPSVLYGFDLQPQLPADYEYANWYLSTHPDSLFRNALIAARAGPQIRHALHNARYSLHAVDGAACSQTVTSVSVLRTLLQDVFAVTVPPGEHADARLDASAAELTTPPPPSLNSSLARPPCPSPFHPHRPTRRISTRIGAVFWAPPPALPVPRGS